MQAVTAGIQLQLVQYDTEDIPGMHTMRFHMPTDTTNDLMCWLNPPFEEGEQMSGRIRISPAHGALLHCVSFPQPSDLNMYVQHFLAAIIGEQAVKEILEAKRPELIAVSREHQHRWQSLHDAQAAWNAVVNRDTTFGHIYGELKPLS